MHRVEETACLLASLALFSLFHTFKDDNTQGHIVSQKTKGMYKYCLKEGKVYRENWAILTHS